MIKPNAESKLGRGITMRFRHVPRGPKPEGSMNTLKPLQALVLTTFAVLLAGGLTLTPAAADPTPGAPPPHPVAATATNAPALKPVVPARTQITGAELYSMHCNRCHPERYPTERTAAQWKTIMLHMQVRANIPGAQARQILKYLQENSGR